MLNTSIPSNPHTPSNLLSILEPLNTFPTEQVELNTWWIPELGSKPKSSSNRKSNSDGRDDIDDKESDEENDTKDGQDDDDDWRKSFDRNSYHIHIFILIGSQNETAQINSTSVSALSYFASCSVHEGLVDAFTCVKI